MHDTVQNSRGKLKAQKNCSLTITNNIFNNKNKIEMKKKKLFSVYYRFRI